MLRWLLLLTATVVASPCIAETRTGDAERGRRTMETRGFNPAAWTQTAYDSLWKVWGLSQKPADYEAAVRERFGLHPAPFPNEGLPMGLRKASGLLGKGIAVDCLLCHGGSIMGKSYIGLGNSTLDAEAVFGELNRANGRSVSLPHRFTNARGTSEAGAMAVYLLGLRNPDLSFRGRRLELGLHDDMCEDPPAWWGFRKKRTMYHTGGADARSVRSLMQFMMGSLSGPATFTKEEATFRDVQAFLRSLRPPRYPLPIDEGLAAKGKQVFETNCARCHGTYGENWTYPNRIVDLDEIGTDPKRYQGLEESFGRYYNQSWFAKEQAGWLADGFTALPTKGYQAPPLDGLWATAPYLHNGSVPTVYHLLKSSERPTIYTRSFRTGVEDYDPVKLGWKVRALDRAPSESLDSFERRKTYDTTQPGRGNGGHIYGDRLTEAERMAVIEYLKTI